MNFCKNPLCSNFGSPAEIEDQRGRSRGNHGTLYIVSGRGDGMSGLLCKACGVSSAIKSNRAVHEEFERNLEALATPGGLRCPAQSCTNYFRTVDSFHDPKWLPRSRTFWSQIRSSAPCRAFSLRHRAGPGRAPSCAGTSPLASAAGQDCPLCGTLDGPLRGPGQANFRPHQG